MDRRTLLVLITMAFLGCTQPKDDKTSAKESFIDKQGDRDISRVYEYDLKRLFDEGMKAVKENNQVKYDSIARLFNRSRAPQKGVSISLLMAVQNNYAKAYFDIVRLYPYKVKECYKPYSEKRLFFFLSMAKKNGYKWKGGVHLFEKYVKYEDVGMPNEYIE
ncbi:hypothetical protein [Saprospira grandis]|uniref:Lipoprotein n=1 Tax=Saprospira grandis (strain Lewin) TaxID=984262 RepID=H6L8X7_SAPGL|nr:hypothetical protein [Saprospira grandis]AFC23113.1 hypothetical protein SGRA_0374 [Saprospira grandis str. Lewin]